MLTTLWSGEGECFLFEAGVLGRSSDLVGVNSGFCILVDLVFLVTGVLKSLFVMFFWFSDSVGVQFIWFGEACLLDGFIFVCLSLL